MNQRALIEAALFVSDKPLTIERLSKILGMGNQQEIKELLLRIQTDYRRDDRGIELVETPEGYEMRVKTEYREKVARLAPFADLSDGMMRALAIIAAKQPIKQSVIVKVQGNKAYRYIASLEDKGLIKTEKAGRTKMITTTIDFEKYFGTSAEDIKNMLQQSEKKKE